MAPISAFLVSYNRIDVVETALRSLRFADQLVVIDKSSTDGTAEIGRRYADHFVSLPWSPSADENRTYALSLCDHDLIVNLDDDECLTCEAINLIRGMATNGFPSDVVSFPFRQYILGRHSETASYWPEYRHSFFRRGAIDFPPTIHGCVRVLTRNVLRLPHDSPFFIYHMSHANTAIFVEKTNRYTSQADRVHDYHGGLGFVDYAHARLEYWRSQMKGGSGDYEEAITVLRLVYDLVDAVKFWESSVLRDGHAEFADLCRTLNQQYDRLSAEFGVNTTPPVHLGPVGDG